MSRKKMADVHVGETIVVDLPCRVRVTSIYRSSVAYDVVGPTAADGAIYIGSLVELEVVDE